MARKRVYYWNAREAELVKQMAGAHSVTEIAAALESQCGMQRTVTAVHNFAEKSGISLDNTGYGTPQLARLFGVSDDQIRVWIGKGLLRATRWMGRCGGGARWYISKADVEAFLRQWPWVYEFSQLDRSHPLYVTALAANRGERWLTRKEVAERLGVSVATVNKMVKMGRFRGECRRRDWLMFRESDMPMLRAVIEQRRAENPRGWKVAA